MPVSGAQHASAHEMLQAAVHSMYIRDGSGPASIDLTTSPSSFFSGSFSGQSPQNFEPPAFRSSRSCEIVLDGDLLAVMEALYREVTVKRALDRSFEDMVKEIHHLIDQMDDAERRTYLAESLFLNTVKYENDKLEAYMKKLTKK